MSELPKKRHRTIFIAAVVLAVPTFGAGLWVGKSTAVAPPMRKPLDVDNFEALAQDSVRYELAACQRKLARRMKANSAASAVGARSDTSDDAGPFVERINVLEKEFQSCQRSERLHGAELCRSVRLHLDALLGLPKNDILCVQRVRVADYIEDDFEKCAAFKKALAESDLEGYAPEERKTILDAVEVAKSLDEEKLTELLNEVHRVCYAAPGANSP